MSELDVVVMTRDFNKRSNLMGFKVERIRRSKISHKPRVAKIACRRTELSER
jgi:hypothetical protein